MGAWHYTSHSSLLLLVKVDGQLGSRYHVLHNTLYVLSLKRVHLDHHPLLSLYNRSFGCNCHFVVVVKRQNQLSFTQHSICTSFSPSAGMISKHTIRSFMLLWALASGLVWSTRSSKVIGRTKSIQRIGWRKCVSHCGDYSLSCCISDIHVLLYLLVSNGDDWKGPSLGGLNRAPNCFLTCRTREECYWECKQRQR